METRIVSLRLPESALRKADLLQTHYGVSRSKLVALLIEGAVNQLELSRDKERLSIFAGDRKK